MTERELHGPSVNIGADWLVSMWRLRKWRVAFRCPSPSAVSMAEVGPRLWSGASRFPALRTGRALPGCSGESRRCPEVSDAGATHGGTGTPWRRGGGACCSVQPSGQQLLLLQQLLAGRTCWSRRTGHTSRDPHQHRPCSTTLLALADLGSQRSRAPGGRLGPSCRSYSVGSGDAGPLYRSRTAYYDILRVSPGATQSQIKTAYYKQSFVYHPDKNPGSEEAARRFSEVSEAYAVLGNVSLRRKYDRGILSQADLRGPGRPSSKEPADGSPGGSKQQQQHKARSFSGKAQFDFDAFYQAHYGDQLQREKILRARRQQMQEQQKKALMYWKGRLMEMTAVLLLATAGLLFISASEPWNRNSQHTDLRGKDRSCCPNWYQVLHFIIINNNIHSGVSKKNIIRNGQSVQQFKPVVVLSSPQVYLSQSWSTCVKTITH